jgi:hypothetical protein
MCDVCASVLTCIINNNHTNMFTCIIKADRYRCKHEVYTLCDENINITKPSCKADF